MAIDKDIGQGTSEGTRSRHFSNLWEKPLVVAGGPEGQNVSKSIFKWMRTGAPIGWRRGLKTCGVFPSTVEDTAAVLKSKQFDPIALGAPFENYRSFSDAAEHADAEAERFHLASFTKTFESLDELRATLG